MGGHVDPNSHNKGTGMARQRRDSVLTIDELSAYLKISKSTLYKLAQPRKASGRPRRSVATGDLTAKLLTRG